MMHPRTVSLLAFTLAASLAACGGGGSSSGGGAGSTPPQPSSNSSTVTLQGQSASAALPPIQGYSGTISMPPGTGTVVITSGMQPPAGVPMPSNFTPMMFVSFMASGGPVSMTQTPGFDMDMMSSSMMGSTSYYMAQYVNGMWTTVEGPAMMSGTSMMMNAAAMPISLQNGQQACFAYYTGYPVGSPSPGPTAMPSMMP